MQKTVSDAVDRYKGVFPSPANYIYYNEKTDQWLASKNYRTGRVWDVVCNPMDFEKELKRRKGTPLPVPDYSEINTSDNFTTEGWGRTGQGGEQLAAISATAAATSGSELAATPWNGGGLPPAGCECEYMLARKWVSAKVIGYDGPACIVALDGYGYRGSDSAADFRPLETEAEYSCEAAVSEMLSHDPSGGMLSRTDFCRALHDAGYRKQEAS